MPGPLDLLGVNGLGAGSLKTALQFAGRNWQ